MGDLDVVALNRVLKWIGLEMTSPQEVRVLVDSNQSPYVRRPQTLLGVATEPNPAGAYSLNQLPQLARIVHSVAPLGTSVWRPRPSAGQPTHEEKRALLDVMRAQMQIPGDDKTAHHGRILATTLYWNAVKSLPLNPAEVRHEAAVLRGGIAVFRNAADRPSQEIARNLDAALGVLLEAHPNVK